MNHIKRISDLEVEYMLLIADLTRDLNRIDNPKRLAEKKQEYDKIVHFHNKMMDCVNELNSWLAVFGSGRVV